MTITYTGKVANARMFAFSRLLFYWKGSIYKLIYKEMAVFCVLYSCLSLIYRLLLDKDQRSLFEKVVLHCEQFANLIPLSFVLGFYVSIVITRWWNQFTNIPWPDRVMVYVSTMIEGTDERSRVLRRTLMRYLSLSSLIVLQATSVVVKKRFPTMEHLLDAGVITLKEIGALEEINTPHGKWWVPMVWSCNLVKKARREGLIADNYCMKTILDELQQFRGQLGMLYSYDWISVPLVYTQVTTLAVYTFFIGCLLGRQFIEPSKGYPGHEVDLFVPVFTLLQFFFYMGWLKVAEQLINPFGEDDDDFDINWVIDRNLQVSLLVVDDLYGAAPTCEKDIYYGESPPDFLPYTKSSISSIKQPYMGSTADLSVSDRGMEVVNHMISIPEGSVLDSNVISPYGYPTASVPVSRPSSPMPSPSKTRRVQNMLQGMRSPLNGSKSSILDGLKAGSCDSPRYPSQFLNLGQSLNGVGISQRSMVDGHLSEPASKVGTPAALFLTKSHFDTCDMKDSIPNTPVDEKSIFVMEMEDDCASKPTSMYDIKNVVLENPDVARVKHIDVASSKHRFTVSECPESMLTQNYVKQDGTSERDLNENAHPANEHDGTLPGNHNNEAEIEQHIDLPEICIDSPKRERHVSGSSHGSSSCSLPCYEPPDSNQATVSSITPLLPLSQPRLSDICDV